MVHILLIQGAGLGASDALVAALRQQAAPGVTIESPAMPQADDPSAASWLPAIGAALQRQSQPFVAIGHSLGGSTLLQWLGANPAPTNLRAVITAAAPYWGAGGWRAQEFALPSGAAGQLGALPCIILNGDADDIVPVDHLALYRAQLPQAEIRIVPGMDHLWSGGAATLLRLAARFA